MPSDVLGLPKNSGVLADAFYDFGLFGEQEFRLIFAGSHRFEVGGFALVVEHCFKKRRNGLQHLYLCRKH